jgi:dipeptidyl aminopeptidase/acylaminoacyl peptidase
MRALLVIATLVSASTAAAQNLIDLDALMALPIPSELTAARDARTLAWVEMRAGVRKIYVDEGGKARVVTAYAEDDGQELSGLTLSGDGRHLAYVRGGTPNEAGFVQNPTSAPDGSKREVYAIDLVHGKALPKLIAEGATPLFAPDGNALVIENGGQLHCYRLSKKTIKNDWCRAPLTHLRGQQYRAVFAPNGRSLSFVSDRGDRAFVATLDLIGRKITWRAPDYNIDSVPVYSADGSKLAFMRLPGLKTDETTNVTLAQPMQLIEVDIASGKAGVRFSSVPRAAGFVYQRFSTPLRYDTADRLIFASEDDGWLRLYALDADSRTPRALSGAACEVENFDVAGTQLIYSGNCAREGVFDAADLRLNRRDLFRVDIGSGQSQRVTSEAAPLYVSPVFAAGGQRVGYLASTATTPLRVHADDCTAQCNGAPISSAFDAASIAGLRPPRQVTFKSPDGLTVHGQLFDHSTTDGKRAAIVFVHGGPMRQMLPAFHYMPYYHRDYAMNQYLASQGYVVLAVNFRSGIGYGQAFRLDPKQGPRGNSEYQDVLAGQAFLAALPQVDAQRIGIYGGSYGGLLTAQALARDSAKFKAGVDLHGVHDWKLAAKQENGAGWGLTEADHELAYQSSPIAAVAQWTSPCLFVHGDDDRSVPFNQSTDLVTRLRAQGVPTQSLVFPDEEHDFLRHDTWMQVYRASAEFFKANL